MDFLKKAMAGIGIGSARVDAILDNSKVRVGEEVTGFLRIKGGNVPQEIEYVYFYLMTKYEKEFDDKKITQNVLIQKETLPVSLTIKENEEKEIPFSFFLSNKAPISAGRYPIWINTGLDIKMAVDPQDNDVLDVKPNSHMEMIFSSLNSMGFRLRNVKNEDARYYHGLPFIQNFEYVPTTEFRTYLDELEVALLVETGYIELLLEVDRRARGIGGLFAEALDIDESKVKVKLTDTDFGQGQEYITDKLRNVISRFSR